jgi:hypothetical protein
MPVGSAKGSTPPPLVMCLPVPPNAGSSSSNIYFNYGRTCHFPRDCTIPKKNNTLSW